MPDTTQIPRLTTGDHLDFATIAETARNLAKQTPPYEGIESTSIRPKYQHPILLTPPLRPTQPASTKSPAAATPPQSRKIFIKRFMPSTPSIQTNTYSKQLAAIAQTLDSARQLA